jgi:hypothetical protein
MRCCVVAVPPKSQGIPSSPQGTIPAPFSFPFSQYNATKVSGGTVKIVDSSTFKISTTIAVAEVSYCKLHAMMAEANRVLIQVTVNPGAMR